ncbi:hypothetical protein [Leptospira noumeaensis]|uniref:hypothetical protein n=1 Tax=Leptospira noumeaensis TaxID=2484964 RepID=UPI001FCA9252|nr:hypothetical protein [Leptospira noumeaensis]
MQRSTLGKEWKEKGLTNPNKLNPIDLIAFYIAYKEVTNTKRALKLLFKILKQQSADVFLEMAEAFRRYGIKIG